MEERKATYVASGRTDSTSLDGQGEMIMGWFGPDPRPAIQDRYIGNWTNGVKNDQVCLLIY